MRELPIDAFKSFLEQEEGQLLEVKRDDQSYGFMSLTPTGRDTDQLKTASITYYRTPKDSKQLEKNFHQSCQASKSQTPRFSNTKVNRYLSTKSC